MHTIEELKKRLTYLKQLSIYPVDKIFSELEEAIQAYIERDSEFELQVDKTLDKVIADAFYHGLVYEHQELISPWQNSQTEDAPIGYDDVTKLFKGDEVFEEIMSVTDKDFKAAFYRNSGNGSANSSTVQQYSNTYLEVWTEALTTAVSEEMAGLKKIMQFCANRGYNVEYAVLFEEHGEILTRHNVRYYAKQIFHTRGYGWLIETFNLSTYRPSYMAELPAWNEDV